MQKLLGFELAHVGINTQDAEDAKRQRRGLAFASGKAVTEFSGHTLRVRLRRWSREAILELWDILESTQEIWSAR